MLKLYGTSEDESCHLCGELREDVYHLLFECVHFKSYRTTYLKLFCDRPYTREDYYLVFKNITKDLLLNIFHFVNATLHARSIYFELMNSVNL
jgi:hypothetical protein